MQCQRTSELQGMSENDRDRTGGATSEDDGKRAIQQRVQLTPAHLL
jgi:hypothetical protein